MVDSEGTRKLTAILAADVAGYSRLMQADEEATVATLEAHRSVFREKIQVHRGRIVDMVGDSVLAVFDAATDAVRAASEIQGVLAERNAALPEARRMRFRIGVNLGEIIERSDGTVYGDGVNVAARLESIAQPGGTVVSGTLFDQVKNRVPLGFAFLGAQQVKNIKEPVRAYQLTEGVSSTFGGARAVHALRRSKRTLVVASIVVLVAIAAAVATKSYLDRMQTAKASIAAGSALAVPEKPSIAVLPFVNMSEDPTQEYFSDGMTEDLITSLSKLSGLFVIARNSVFTYKGRPVKPEQISHELGVRYVLEGSVRKAGPHVRITAQLIDATTGYHVWAEHYDGELKDVFALQDSITGKIVSALSPKLTASEQMVREQKDTSSIEAYDLYLRGYALLLQQQQKATADARKMFEKVITLDPQYARAYVSLSWTYFNDWVYQWTHDPHALERSLELAGKAVALDDSLPQAHDAWGWNLVWQRQHDRGVAEMEKAVSLAPNDADAYAHLADGLNLAGRPDEAIGFAKKAIRLDPNHGPWLVFFLGNSYFYLRRYDEAIAAYRAAIAKNNDYPPAHMMLAVTYTELGRDQEARAAAAEVMRLSPNFSVDVLRSSLPMKNTADLDRITSGLRKAGLK